MFVLDCKIKIKSVGWKGSKFPPEFLENLVFSMMIEITIYLKFCSLHQKVHF
jgi:hypothetical protein